MANSKYSYVRDYELADSLLPNTFVVIRIDGHGFHRFSTIYEFEKPNDRRALELMNAAARKVMESEIGTDCVMAFGESDEYSFVYRRSLKLYNRRQSKLLSTLVSTFSSAYTLLWHTFFPNGPALSIQELPSFDGRIVQYPTEAEIRDYMRWRQVDTHINNLYNTCFWTLVQQGHMTTKEANKELSGTVSSQKHEILFSRFGINYNAIDPMFRKGSLWIWETESDEAKDVPFSPASGSKPSDPADDPPPEPSKGSTRNPTDESSAVSSSVEKSKPVDLPDVTDGGVARKEKRTKKGKILPPQRRLVLLHEDIIKDTWWEAGRGKGILS